MVRKTEKRAMKDLKQDSLVLQVQKNKDNQNLMNKKDQNYKKLLTIMEAQQLEYKQIKTTQIQDQSRNKIKKRRLAGNQTDIGEKTSKKLKVH